MSVQQIGFAVFDDPVGILQIGLSLADGLDLCTPEGNAGFELVQQEVVMSRGAIYGSVALTGGDRLPGLRFLRGWIRSLTRWPGHTFDYESSC
jgi:hypothetical protein